MQFDRLMLLLVITNTTIAEQILHARSELNMTVTPPTTPVLLAPHILQTVSTLAGPASAPIKGNTSTTSDGVPSITPSPLVKDITPSPLVKEITPSPLVEEITPSPLVEEGASSVAGPAWGPSYFTSSAVITTTPIQGGSTSQPAAPSLLPGYGSAYVALQATTDAKGKTELVTHSTFLAAASSGQAGGVLQTVLAQTTLPNGQAVTITTVITLPPPDSTSINGNQSTHGAVTTTTVIYRGNQTASSGESQSTASTTASSVVGLVSGAAANGVWWNALALGLICAGSALL